MYKMRTCKFCKIDKDILFFVRRRYKGDWLYSYKCKECNNSQFRTGKENLGRFKKGVIPKTAWKPGNICWNKGKKLNGISRNSNANYEWRNKVKERDGFKCIQCGKEKYLHVHHIIPFEKCIELRFDINNGETLCSSCHKKKEGSSCNIGRNVSAETREKLRAHYKGKNWIIDSETGKRKWIK